MITCLEACALVTDYLDGEMGFMRKMKFKLHIAICPNCKTHLNKMRQLIASMGRIPPDTEIPEEMLDHLSRLLS
ncbi:MAG: zf-HC2 domain-containing protein [Myxococcota bacterium]|nr:zf-HC2 domain-containing protein [Myxococcota bacterium]